MVPDDDGACALEDLDHAAHALPGAPPGDASVNAHYNGVARKGDSRVVRGDLDRRLIPFAVNDNERGTAGSELDYAFD